MSNSFDRDFAYGAVEARKVAAWLKRHGIGVVLASDRLGGSAPMFEDLSGGLPMLDLLTFWKARMEAWDSKAKRDTGVLRVADDLVTTGINASALEKYFEFERRTHIPVRIVFVHPHRDEVRLARLMDFDPRLSNGNGGGRGERLAYCAVERLEWLCTYAELDGEDPDAVRAGGPRPPWMPKRPASGIQDRFDFGLPARPPVGVKGWLQP